MTPFGYIVTLTTGGRTECMDEDQVYEALAEDGQLYDLYIDVIEQAGPDHIYDWLFDTKYTDGARKEIDDKVYRMAKPMILDGTINDIIQGDVRACDTEEEMERIMDGEDDE